MNKNINRAKRIADNILNGLPRYLLDMGMKLAIIVGVIIALINMCDVKKQTENIRQQTKMIATEQNIKLRAYIDFAFTNYDSLDVFGKAEFVGGKATGLSVPDSIGGEVEIRNVGNTSGKLKFIKTAVTAENRDIRNDLLLSNSDTIVPVEKNIGYLNEDIPAGKTIIRYASIHTNMKEMKRAGYIQIHIFIMYSDIFNNYHDTYNKYKLWYGYIENSGIIEYRRYHPEYSAHDYTKEEIDMIMDKIRM